MKHAIHLLSAVPATAATRQPGGIIEHRHWVHSSHLAPRLVTRKFRPRLCFHPNISCPSTFSPLSIPCCPETHRTETRIQPSLQRSLPARSDRLMADRMWEFVSKCSNDWRCEPCAKSYVFLKLVFLLKGSNNYNDHNEYSAVYFGCRLSQFCCPYLDSGSLSTRTCRIHQDFPFGISNLSVGLLDICPRKDIPIEIRKSDLLPKRAFLLSGVFSGQKTGLHRKKTSKPAGFFGPGLNDGAWWHRFALLSVQPGQLRLCKQRYKVAVPTQHFVKSKVEIFQTGPTLRSRRCESGRRPSVWWQSSCSSVLAAHLIVASSHVTSLQCFRDSLHLPSKVAVILYPFFKSWKISPTKFRLSGGKSNLQLPTKLPTRLLPWRLTHAPAVGPMSDVLSLGVFHQARDVPGDVKRC